MKPRRALLLIRKAPRPSHKSALPSSPPSKHRPPFPTLLSNITHNSPPCTLPPFLHTVTHTFPHKSHTHSHFSHSGYSAHFSNAPQFSHFSNTPSTSNLAHVSQLACQDIYLQQQYLSIPFLALLSPTLCFPNIFNLVFWNPHSAPFFNIQLCNLPRSLNPRILSPVLENRLGRLVGGIRTSRIEYERRVREIQGERLLLEVREYFIILFAVFVLIWDERNYVQVPLVAGERLFVVSELGQYQDLAMQCGYKNQQQNYWIEASVNLLYKAAKSPLFLLFAKYLAFFSEKEPDEGLFDYFLVVIEEVLLSDFLNPNYSRQQQEEFNELESGKRSFSERQKMKDYNKKTWVFFLLILLI
jgi:hypothetical protein